MKNLILGAVFFAGLLAGCGGGGITIITPPPTSQYDTAEYRENARPNTGRGLDPFFGALRRMDVLYAYNLEFHGQGVTVVNRERLFAAHEDLAGNVLTMSINVDFSNIPVGTYSNPEINRIVSSLRVDRFGRNYDAFASIWRTITLRVSPPGFRYSHGTGSAGVIAAERNGKGAHGVAPEAKIIPLPGASQFGHAMDRRDIQFILDNNIPIVNHSFLLNDGLSNSPVRNGYALAKDSDTIFVFSAGDHSGLLIREDELDVRNFPRWVPELEDNWLIVEVLGALEPKDARSNRSPICGTAMRWCITTDGNWHNIPTFPNTNSYRNYTFTSAGASMVSGALALLKSAANELAPGLPMKMIRSILLATATDIGASGIDNIYGWGFVNVSAGIDRIKNMQTAKMAGFAPVKLSALKQEFPARFAHLREKMGELTIAIEITDGAYYNMPLADIIPPQTEKQINFGNAAEEMLTENTEMQKSGFVAFGDSSAGFGLHWNDTYENAGMWAELSYAPKTAGIVGAETGAKIGIRRPLFGGIFAFGEYGGGFAKAQTGEIGYISAAESIKTEEWTAGVDYLDLWQKRDKLRFAVRQGKRISGGKIAVNLPVATGDFYKSFLGEKLQDLEIARAEISLAEKAPLIFSAGYSVQRNKSEWAAAAEYAENGKGKLSAKWKITL